MVADQLRTVVILLYDGVAADEAALLVDIFSQGGLKVIMASVAARPVTSYHGRAVPTRPAEGFGPLGALIVPGGMGVQAAAEDLALMEAVGVLARSARWIGSTSTGSVLLGAAGVIDGARATTHWLARDLLAEREVELVDARYVEHGRLLTASGIASSPELAFRVVGALAGIQAEASVRAQYQPPKTSDRRYVRPPKRFWSWPTRRHRIVNIGSLDRLDPSGQAEAVVLELSPSDP